MKVINPTQWRLQEVANVDAEDDEKPLISLINARGHAFHIHPIDRRLVRIVHSLPETERGACGTLDGVPLRNHNHVSNDNDGKVGKDGFCWERRSVKWLVYVDENGQKARLMPEPLSDTQSAKGYVCIEIDYSYTISLTWIWREKGKEDIVFLRDFKTAYKYDARSKRVYHVVCRDQSYMPTSEHARSANENHIPQLDRFEYIYGLGECKGPMMKDGKRYVIEARDSLAADPQDTDPLYKIMPYYLHYNHSTRFWFGLYYNTLVPSVFDFSGEHDFATGQFRFFSAERGPLDYYMLLGDEDGEAVGAGPLQRRPKPATIVSQLARLVTPASFGPAGRRIPRRDTETDENFKNDSTTYDGWQASPCLPPHNQFGYLASSLTMSERPDAQKAVVEYIEQARAHGFAVDSMHLSSGYCVDAKTGERKYFYWDRQKYPDPAAFGRTLEQTLHCKVIINVKPWLLESHPYYDEAARQGAFLQCAKDARPSAVSVDADADRCATTYDTFPSRTLHWARGMGDTGLGSYIDYSSEAGAKQWQSMIRTGVLSNNITGIWDDNNEFSSIVDDEDELRGEVEMWSLPPLSSSEAEIGVKEEEQARQVAQRMGWGKRGMNVGAVGAATLTMGMARATFVALLDAKPNERPVIVTRSAVPGVQAFAHSTWSGDNSTTWLSLRWSTKLSMSVGLSFGLGLYGHDIGGFAGTQNPSAELLVRWCQQSMWMTRFTIHSWKPISTTPWMYDERVTGILQKVIGLRYRLLPTLYSLYVTQYHRHGWPVIRPLLWHHSVHVECLAQDEQFLLGSHILVAPVCQAGQQTSTFFLPNETNDENEEEDDLCWYEMDTGFVHRPKIHGNLVTLDAPLDRCPALVREGGMYVLGEAVTSHIASPAAHDRTYTAYIFPAPLGVLEESHHGIVCDANRPDEVNVIVSRGHFALFEDDGTTNEATGQGRFTEMRLHFEQSYTPDNQQQKHTVRVSIEVLQAGHPGKWKVKFVLPPRIDDAESDDVEICAVAHPASRNGANVKVSISDDDHRDTIVVYVA